jgi:tetratricopeptide (TPR) repeat protein
MKKNYPVLVGIFFLIFSSVTAQDKITLKDAKEISYQAKATVQGLEGLLNYVSFADNVPSELQEVIANSYKNSRNRVFYNKNIIIEDDITPESGLGKTKDLPAEKYLNDFDIHYTKTPDASVSFSNIYVSSVKKKDYVYVKVKFDSKFGSKFKLKNTGYTTRTREALLRMESEGGNRWKALIVGINFYNPANPLESTENNIGVTTDESLNASIVSLEDLSRERDSYIQAKEAEERQKDAIFQEYFSLGTSLFNNRQYKEALELFEKAKEIKALVPSLDKRILETKRMISENTYDNFKNKGDRAKSERRFKEAIVFYKEALAIKPDAYFLVDAEITPLTKKLDELSLPKNKLESGDLQGAIDECDKILKENKKAKNEFPEVFYIKGLAYQLMAERKLDDSRSRDRAIESFNSAIEYFPNYVDARLARANFFIRHKSDFVSAITDYDVLTTNALDDAPEKSGYFVAKAKLKSLVQNFTGAQEDFRKAISLSPNTASHYFDLGELQYKLKMYEEARKSFDKAIELNPQYNTAYYYRGLNYVELKEYKKAGADFNEGEKIGLETFQLQQVESISNSFFVTGQNHLLARNFINADEGFNNALSIRECNSLALHGKGEIRFLTAEDLNKGSRFKASKESYKEAIDLYKQAIKCNPTYSEAQYKQGLAHHRIEEYNLALQSYTDAITSDATNIKAHVERGNTKQVVKDFLGAVPDYNTALTLLAISEEAAKKGNNSQDVITIKNDISTVYQLYGKSMYNLQQYPSALTALDNAIKINKTNAEALYYRGLVYEATNGLSKALKNYAAAIEVAKDYKYFYANGSAFHKAEKFDLAITNFDQAMLQDTLPVIVNRNYLRGQSYFKSKMWNQAAADFAEYAKIEASKADSPFFADYALANLYLGQDSAAFENFNQALMLKSDNAKALFGLGCAYAKSGNYDKALEVLEMAYQTGILSKNDIKLEEETFLAELNKIKANKNRYNQLKKTYLVTAK